MTTGRIVIHAGFHKTGTSTVQHTLKNNRKSLRPYLRSVLKGQMQDLLHAARGYSTWRDPFTLDKFNHRFHDLIVRFSGETTQTLCLSAEELSGHLPGRPGLMSYDAAPVLATEMARVIGTVRPDANLVFFYSTRTTGWLRSAYWEHVKASSMTMDWAEFAETHTGAAALQPIVDAVRDAQPFPVHCSTLETLTLMPAGPATPVLKLCDVPDQIISQLPPPPPVNRAGDEGVLLALLAANRDYADRDARKAAKQAILKAAQETDGD